MQPRLSNCDASQATGGGTQPRGSGGGGGRAAAAAVAVGVCVHEAPLELGRRLLAVEERLNVLEEDPLYRPLPLRGTFQEADHVLDLFFVF